MIPPSPKETVGGSRPDFPEVYNLSNAVDGMQATFWPTI